jgi:hypothetical protein
VSAPSWPSKAPPELLERLRAAAAAERRTVTGLVIEWIEAGLSGALPAAGATPAAGAELLERVAALETGLAELRAAARVTPAPRSGERVEPLRVPLGRGQLEIIGANHLRPPAEPEPASPERVNPAALSGDALTTAELCERYGLSRGSWNNWAGGAGRVGTVRHHPTAGSWRLIGKAPAPGGGPDRWLWEPVEA